MRGCQHRRSPSCARLVCPCASNLLTSFRQQHHTQAPMLEAARVTLLLSAGDGSTQLGGDTVAHHHGVQRLHHHQLHDRHHTPHKG